MGVRRETQIELGITLMPYEEIPHPEIHLPERVRHEDYARRPLPREMLVPEVYRSDVGAKKSGRRGPLSLG